MRTARFISGLLLMLPLAVPGQQLLVRTLEESDAVGFKGLCQADNGCLWLIDDKTLYAYDGYNVVPKVTADSAHVGFTMISYVSDRILVGTKNGYLLELVADSLHERGKVDQAPITDILSTDNGDLLIATYGQGLWLSQGEQPLERVEGSSVAGYINDLERINGAVYIASDAGLWFVEHPVSAKPVWELMRDHVFSTVLMQGDTLLWAAEFSGAIHRTAIGSGVFDTFAGPEAGFVKDLAVSGSRLFLATDKGLFHWDQAVGSAPEFIKDHTAAHERLLIDDEFDLWTTMKSGLSFASLYFSELTGIPLKNIRGLSNVGDAYYFGTDQGVFRYHPPSGIEQLLPTDISVTCMIRKDSLLVIGTFDSGLYVGTKDGLRKLIISGVPRPGSNAILSISAMNGDSMVVSTLGGTMIITREVAGWSIAKVLNQLDNEYILCSSVMANGDVWLGTDKKGAVRYAQGTLQVYRQSVSEEKLGTVFSVVEDEEGQIWALSEYVGLVRFDGNGFRGMPCPHGSWDRYTGLVSLPDGKLLMVGEREVVVYHSRTDEMLSFQKEIRLERGESYLNNHVVADGRVLFEHNGRLLYYHEPPSGVRTHPRTSLRKVSVDLRPINMSNTQFKEDENNFTFEFVGVMHRSPQLVSYEYMLEGLDKTWRRTSDRMVSYPKLVPGNYTFKVRSSHDVDEFDQEPVTYSFQISQYFYNSLWFRTLMVLLFVGSIIWMVIRHRKVQLIRSQLELLRTETQLMNLKSQLNPHFLFNSFNTVIGLVEEDAETGVAYIQHLTDFYRKVLELSSNELVTLAEELEMIGVYAELLAGRFGNALSVKIDVQDRSSLIPPLGLQLLVENAMKHNVADEARPLLITITDTDESIVVSNTLNRKTIGKDSLGIGLENLRRRYQLLAGKKLEVKTTSTRFEVVLPKITQAEIRGDRIQGTN